jgi:hypothetical protein
VGQLSSACEQLRGDFHATLPAAFVTFRSRTAQVTSCLPVSPYCSI